MDHAVDERQLPSYAAGAVAVPFVIGFHQERPHRETHWPGHSHPTHELLWNTHGVSSVTVEHRTWTVTPVLGMWIPAGVRHSGRAPAGSCCNMSHFGFATVASISDTPVPVTISALLRLLLERLADPDLSAGSRAITEAAAIDNLEPASHDLSVCRPQAELLQPIVAAMDVPAPARRLQDWAAHLNVNPRTISRAFKLETGSDYSRWVASRLAEHAIAMVARGDDLPDIADQLGYRSVSALGAAFRRTTGFTLSAFREGPH